MARLFIFAIGGTGSRVLKSLTMLLAAGVKPRSEFEIVPIIIDPHKGNEDLKRTQELLENYQSISDEVGLDNGFFGTKITTLRNLVSSDSRISNNFTFNLQEVSNTRFKDYINYGDLGEPSKALAEILFSGKSIDKNGRSVDLLETEMDIGFVGNPNIGSVVLNQFKDSDEFREVASNFGEQDRIFIVSSIFGGTGAAGFPTILKNIRNAMNLKVDSKGFLRDAKIGAITVLPYFNIETDKKSPIQKSDFIAKTKSALYYYKDNVTGNKSINCLYYIADNFTGKPYANDPGNGGQKNDAHFIELASALAIIDFLEIPDSRLKTVEGKAEHPIYKEFGIEQDVADIDFSGLGIGAQKKIMLPLAQLLMFKKFLENQLNESVEKQPWSVNQPELNRHFFEDAFYRSFLARFLESFRGWLEEMSNNKRGFAPFNLDSKLETLLKHKTAKSDWMWRKVDYLSVDSKLNEDSQNEQYRSAQQKLLKLFHEATRDILTSKSYGLK